MGPLEAEGADRMGVPDRLEPLVAQGGWALVARGLIAWGPLGDLGAPSRAGGPLLGEILGMCLVMCSAVVQFKCRILEEHLVSWIQTSYQYI